MVDKIIEELIFWREKCLRSHNNFDEKEQYYKKCYELLESVGWEVNKLTQYEESIGITGRTISNYARKYAIMYLKMDEKIFTKKLWSSRRKESEQTETIEQKKVIEQTDEILVNNGKKQKIEINNKFNTFDKYDIVLEKLVSIPKQNKEEIIELIKKLIVDDHSTVIDLRKRIDLFILSEYPEQGRNLLISLEEKIEIYSRYVEEKNKLSAPSMKFKDKNIFEIELHLKGYMESDFIKVESYCEEQGITLEYFNRLLDRCKIYDIDLLKQYREKLAKKRDAFSEKVAVLAKEMAKLIINGVEENGKVRPFDVIDYYQLTNIDFYTFSSLLTNRLSYEEIKAVKAFLNKNKLACKVRLIEIEKIREEKIKVGYPILVGKNSTEKEYYYPTKEERELIISFMEQNLPLNAYNYSKVLLRYLEYTLPLKQVNQTKKLQLR